MIFQNLIEKIKILLKGKKLFHNWYLFPIVYFKLTKKNTVIFEAKTGLKITIRVNSTDLMALTHVWLIQEYFSPGFEISNDDTVLDIGAHIGLFALYASQFCKNGKILCFEPIKKNYDLLVKNIQINNLTNVVPFNLAVSNKTEKIKIYLNEDESGHSMFLENSQFIQVNSISIADIFDKNNIEKCNFLKLDCEGAEYDIIDLLSKNYLNRIEKTIIEYHMADTKPQLLDNLKTTLENNLFKIKSKPLFSDIGFLFAKQ